MKGSENGTEVLLMFSGGSAVDEDGADVGETEIQVFQDVVNEVLESLGGVP